MAQRTAGGSRAPQAVGLDRRAKTTAECGLCGTIASLTKTHVPPQCAGNRRKVGRQTLVAHGGVANRKKPIIGGLYTFGLCPSCNGDVQGQYDPAYAELVRGVKRLWVREWRIDVPRRIELPSVAIRPGAVARSVLVGCFGLSPLLRRLDPELAAGLLHREPTLDLHTDMRLRLALARGTSARITGPVAGYFVNGPRVNDRPIGINSHVQIYFPPLAWQLASPDSVVLDWQGWADVTDWLHWAPDEVALLSKLCPSLPAVAHPLQHPNEHAWWMELLSSGHAPILESRNLPRDMLVRV